jgi:CAAX protease family protein
LGGGSAAGKVGATRTPREGRLDRDRFSPYEFGIVVATAFGWPMATSVLSLLYGMTVGEAGARESFGDSHLYGLLVFELAVFPAVALILYLRGWRAKDFPLEITKAATFVGVLGYFASWIIDNALDGTISSMFSSLRPALDSFQEYRPRHPASLVAVYLVSVINPVFEEVVVCGYVIPTLSRRFGETTAINVSVLIRGSYHLYQGLAVLPYHLIYGLMQAYLYVRLRNLWPLLVSHALADFVPLAFFI